MGRMTLVLVAFCFGCSLSTRNQKNNLVSDDNGALNLRQLVGNPSSVRKISDSYLDEGQKFAKTVKERGLSRATQSVCNESRGHLLCKVFSKPVGSPAVQKPPSVNTIETTTVARLLRQQKFAELSGATVHDIIRGTKYLDEKNLKSVLVGLKKDNCQRSEIYVGVASALEVHFPEPDSVDSAKALLLKSSRCHRDDWSKFALYRLGIFNIWGNDCGSAESQLSGSMDHSQNFFRSRAVYWQNRCTSKSAQPIDREVSSFYRQFPLSLYPLLEVGGDRFDAYRVVKNNEEPIVEFRSAKNAFLNDGLELIELFQEIQEPELVTQVFSRLDISEIQKEPKGLQLYIAYLLSEVQSHLSAFQILAKLFQAEPGLKTQTSMKLFYPIRYLEQVSLISGEIDPFLLLALIRQESAFNKMARSSKDARGLMQVMPALAKSHGYTPKDMFDPEKNVKVGIRFFEHLLKRYNGNVHLALAAYNAGAQTVDSWVKRYPTDDFVLFMDLIPYRETRDYIAAIMRNWYWYSNLYAEKRTILSASN